jgi:hypothetical protein
MSGYSLSPAGDHLFEFPRGSMKIVVAGGTGQVGAILCRAFSAAGR